MNIGIYINFHIIIPLTNNRKKNAKIDQIEFTFNATKLDFDEKSKNSQKRIKNLEDKLTNSKVEKDELKSKLDEQKSKNFDLERSINELKTEIQNNKGSI